MDKFQKLILGVVVIVILGIVALYGTIAYVVTHFISKFW